MKRKIILYELNEVPLRVLNWYSEKNPTSALAKKLRECRIYETRCEDKGHLSPWITWPTLHRGVSNEKHGISDLGQDLKEVDKTFPPIWKVLAAKGVKVGVCGSLHSYPIPENSGDYAFFVPDSFASGSECVPKELGVFQDFNLRMSRQSARNVNPGVPWGAVSDLIWASGKLGIRKSTFARAASQLLAERLVPSRKVRRRSFQAVLSFDVFIRQLRMTLPDFATFFTNHAASAMHRYWAATFPQDYATFTYPSDWVASYSGELEHAIKVADDIFGKLVSFCEEHHEFEIWLTSSMGQAATQTVAVQSQLFPSALDVFMQQMGVPLAAWSQRPAMFPQINVVVDLSFRERFREALSSLKIGGQNLAFLVMDDGFFRLDFGQTNLPSDSASLRGSARSFEQLGLSNVDIDEKSGANAYHIPEGLLLIWRSQNRFTDPRSRQISTLEIAPSILRALGQEPAGYMQRGSILQETTA